MKNKPLDLLNQMIEKPENMSMEQMDNLVKKSLQFFSEYINIAKSGNKEAQEKALKELMEFKDSLQSISQKAAEQSGVSTTDLIEMMSNKSNFSEEQWESMKGITESITQFNTSLMSEFMPSQSKSVPKTGRAPRKQHISI